MTTTTTTIIYAQYILFIYMNETRHLCRWTATRQCARPIPSPSQPGRPGSARAEESHGRMYVAYCSSSAAFKLRSRFFPLDVYTRAIIIITYIYIYSRDRLCIHHKTGGGCVQDTFYAHTCARNRSDDTRSRRRKKKKIYTIRMTELSDKRRPLTFIHTRTHARTHCLFITI